LERLAPFFSDKASYGAHLRGLVSGELAARVRFVGSIPYDELPAYYASAEMLVVPSVFDEPFGLPLAEAMAAGIPCIATQAGAFAEIVEDQRTGLLVPRANVSALADAMSAILGDPERGRRMGKLGRERCERLFSWNHNAKILVDYFGCIIGSELRVSAKRTRDSDRGRSELAAVRSDAHGNNPG